jgi:rhamnulokinase
MPANTHYLAFDFGAESSRAVCGALVKNNISLKEIYRFPTGMLSLNNHFYWNIYRFYEEMLKALSLCTQKENLHPQSVAVDSWGVDFGFLAEDDTILRIPYAYRDLQVIEAMNDFHSIIPPERIYSLTGIAMMPINSLYHMHAMKINNDPVLRSAKRLMFIPDLLNFLLSGEKKTEFSFATTSQLYNPFKGGWEDELITKAGLDISYMNEIIQPGCVIGQLKDEISRQTGLRQATLTSVCSHDTGSAIVAVPARGEEWAYISSGTWSLMGLELDSPLVNEKTFEYNFSNEGGAEGRFRFLKNIMGLWLLQQCQKQWSGSGREFSYPDLIDKADKATPFLAFIDPDRESFFNPPYMLTAIDDFCTSSSQPKPVNEGQYVRVILESLALKYRHVLDQLSEVSGRNINTIHIIGGGIRNKLLCQFTANATGKKVIAGPVEGTAAGNILMQAMAHGHIGSLEEIREIVRNSFELEYYHPEDTQAWENAYRNFLKILKSP